MSTCICKLDNHNIYYVESTRCKCLFMQIPAATVSYAILHDCVVSLNIMGVCIRSVLVIIILVLINDKLWFGAVRTRFTTSAIK